MFSYERLIPRWLREISEHLKTSEICNEVVDQFPCALEFVLNELKMQEMCNEAILFHPAVFFLVPGRFKKEGMCKKAVEDDPFSLKFVPDWFVTQEQLDIWLDDDYWCHNDELIKWYKDYQKCKARKAKVKEELLSVAWHPV